MSKSSQESEKNAHMSAGNTAHEGHPEDQTMLTEEKASVHENHEEMEHEQHGIINDRTMNSIRIRNIINSKKSGSRAMISIKKCSMKGCSIRGMKLLGEKAIPAIILICSKISGKDLLFL